MKYDPSNSVQVLYILVQMIFTESQHKFESAKREKLRLKLLKLFDCQTGGNNRRHLKETIFSEG